MSDKSSIEWTDATWNPTRGCTKIAQGCKNCYAETFAERFRGVPGHPYEQGFDPRLAPDQLTLPLKWKKPRRIFVDSMSDLFHETFPFEYIATVFGVMAACPQHTFQVLTKRPERAAKFFRDRLGLQSCEETVAEEAMRRADVVWDARGADEWRYPALHGASVANRRAWPGWPLPNVWIGTSIAEQKDADKNIPYLLQIPAAVRFLSVEPLIGPVSFRWTPYAHEARGESYRDYLERNGSVNQYEALRQVQWVIVGGESGHGARPCNVSWIRSLVEQCQSADVPVFVKQLGSHVIDRNDAGFDGEEPTHWPNAVADQVQHDPNGYREEYQGAPVRVRLSKKGGDWNEWPDDLRIRQYPEVA